MASSSTGERKGRYKVTNWREYNESLVRRGDITFWFDEDVVAAWQHANAGVKVGRPYVYSDVAIEALLTLRELLRFPYRQTEGFAHTLTTSHVVDARQVEPLLEQVPGSVQKFYGDGAYDQWDVYRALATRNITPIISIRRTASIRQHAKHPGTRLPRDENLRQLRRLGRRGWKRAVGYHRRSLVETAFSRLKRIFGELLKNRHLDNQRTEAALRCKLLNHFTHLGLPKFIGTN